MTEDHHQQADYTRTSSDNFLGQLHHRWAFTAVNDPHDPSQNRFEMEHSVTVAQNHVWGEIDRQVNYWG